MRFLGLGDWNDLGDLYLRLAADGHEVRVHIADAEAHDVLGGLVERVDDWRAELDWLRAAGSDGIILVETATRGALQDELRAAGHQVIGGSGFGDRLELDRAFGQEVLRACGLDTLAIHRFADHGQALAFLRRRPGRYVYKPDGSYDLCCRTYVGQRDDGADIAALLEARPTPPHGFVLMDHVAGVEVGVGAYFDGERFLDAVCLDWEHKRFFPGDLGELTGEMGTLVTYRGSQALFARTLAPLAERLRAAGHVGYLNLNTIVDRQGRIWPLEFTCRFGYPGYAILDPLHRDGWAGLFRTMVRRDGASVPTHDGFALGVVLTVPPFPWPYGYAELTKGTPIALAPEMTAADRDALHLAEVARADDRLGVRGRSPRSDSTSGATDRKCPTGWDAAQLVCSGQIGYLMVATGRGPTAGAARAAAYRVARQVIVPDLRYRTDIGDRFIDHDGAELVRLGLLPADLAAA